MGTYVVGEKWLALEVSGFTLIFLKHEFRDTLVFLKYFIRAKLNLIQYDLIQNAL